jgi:hypothetical protein
MTALGLIVVVAEGCHTEYTEFRPCWLRDLEM